MELSFTEIEDTGNSENYNTYYDDLIPQIANTQQRSHYNNQNNVPNKQIVNNTIKTQQPKPTLKPKRKSVSYDDILSSMNTVVIDGKLEFVRKNNLQNIVENQQQPQQNKKNVTFNQAQNNQQPQINKNSYIYNKFFKGYKEPDQVQNEQPMRPLTKNELIKQLIINKVNAINERNRIAQIKSTKLSFNNNNNRNIVINSRPIHNPNGMNHLFNFK
jgi:hypothetical protein